MKCFRCPTDIPAVQSRFFDHGQSYALCEPCAVAVRAHVTSTPTMSVAAMQTPFPVVSHGKTFRVMAACEMWHPSWWSHFDEAETREAWWNIEPGDVVADIGADFGSYTLSALAQGAAHVYAWSPPFKHPTEAIECEVLSLSAKLNGWRDKLSLYPTGLWSEAGFLAAYDGDRMARFCRTMGEAMATIQGQPGNCAAFPVSTLDSREWTNLDWIKIDTEGAEAHIITGGMATIRKHKPKILFENHCHIDPACEAKCRAILEPMGYTWVGTRQHGVVSHTLMVPT